MSKKCCTGKYLCRRCAQPQATLTAPEPPDLQQAVRERLPRTATRPRRETYAEHADRLAGLFRSFVTPVGKEQ